MKKFVIVIISFLVLFIFLVLNYLLWDKENLLKQRDTDKIEQDWLRGENRNLQATVEELELNVDALEDQNDTYRDEIVELEQQVRLALQRENSYLKEILEKNRALSDYKALMKEKIITLVSQWFDDISKKKYEASFNLLNEDFTLWSNRYDAVEYISLISLIENISIQEEQKDTNSKPFIILEDEDPYIVKAQILVNAAIKENKKIEELEDGANSLEVRFKYNRDTENWAIVSVKTLRTGKP